MAAYGMAVALHQVSESIAHLDALVGELVSAELMTCATGGLRSDLYLLLSCGKCGSKRRLLPCQAHSGSDSEVRRGWTGHKSVIYQRPWRTTEFNTREWQRRAGRTPPRRVWSAICVSRERGSDPSGSLLLTGPGWLAMQGALLRRRV